MKKTIAMAAVFAATSVMADISITGSYEGTVTDAPDAASTYSQDIDLFVKGRAGDAQVNLSFEDLASGSAVQTTEAYIVAPLEGLTFKGGSMKGQNGDGLLQKKSAPANKMKLSTEVEGFGLTYGQTSGDGNGSVDVSANVGGFGVKVQNASNDTRFITITGDVGPVAAAVERQEASTDKVNTAYSVTGTVGPASVTYVNVDVQDAAGVTQDDGILGDISDATAGNDLYGVVGSFNAVAGKVTGKYINKNNAKTYVAKLERGMWEFSHTKPENTDGTTKAVIKVTF